MLLAGILMGCAFATPAIAQSAPTEPLTLWYTTPADENGVKNAWMEYYLPIGNGQFGAMLSGGVAKDEIQFNEKTLWEGNKDQIAETDNVYGAYQNFGSLYVSTGHGSKSNYIRTLDLTTATGTVTYTYNGVAYGREYIASNPDNVVAAHYTASEKGNLNLTVTFAGGRGEAITYAGGEGSFGGKLETVTYNARFKVVNIGGELTSSAGGVTVKNADEVVILLAGATDFDNSNPTYTSGITAEQLAQEVTGRLKNAADKGWTAVYEDHVKDHQSLFGRMSLQFNGASNTMATDKLVGAYGSGSASQKRMLEELYFAYGRYLAIASSRGVALPSNLQGIWNNNNGAAWNSDIHANINVQMNYWPVETTNLSEMHMPFLDWTIRMSNSAEWKRYAQHACSGSTATSQHGWNVYTENNIFGGIGVWKHNNKVGNAWLCTHLWEHYRYTLDKDFLHRAFPTMLSATEYWLDILVEKNGEYLCPEEYSPEQGPNSEDGVAYSQQLVAELFANTLAAVDVLGESVIDAATLADLKNKYAKLDKGMATETYTGTGWTDLSSWPKNLNGITNGTSILREWKYSDYSKGEKNHRHLSPLMCLYPFNQITDANIRTAAINLLQMRGDGATGWAMGWKINLWARALDGNHAYTIIQNVMTHSTSYDTDQSKGGIYYNLFDSHSPFQIDGNFGYTAGVAEMLLQSQAGYLHIMPAMPDAWRTGGEVKGLKGRGNFTVDFTWNTSGKVTRIAITNVKGQECRVKCGQGMKPLADAYISVGGKTVEAKLVEGSTDVYAIPSAAGDEIVIDFVNDAPVEMTTIEIPVSISADDKFGTCVLPYDATLPAGVKAYTCEEVDEAKSVLVLKEAYSLQANTPCLLYATNGVEHTFSGQVDMSQATNRQTFGLLTGFALEPATVTLGANSYVLQGDGAAGTLAFYNAEGITLTFPAGKCYLQLPAAVKARRLRLFDDTTGIVTPESGSRQTEVYDLNGRKVNQLVPGNIYIINGKKVMVK